MRLKHGAKVRQVLRSGDLVLEDRVCDPEDLISTELFSLIYNRNISGGIDWWNPSTGEPLEHRPKMTIELVNPDDELKGAELCDCKDCGDGPLTEAEKAFVAAGGDPS